MSKLHSLFLFLFLSSLFVSCQDIKYDKQKISLLREVLLLQVSYDSQSLNKNNVVQYPYDEFICESFVKSLVSNFNLNTNGFNIKAPFFDIGKSEQNLEEDLLKSTYLRQQKDFIDNMGTIGLIDHQKIPAKEIEKLLAKHQSSSYLVIDFKSSVWRQDFSGSFKIFSKKGEMIFHYGLKNKNSKYIIYDATSPYVIRDNEFFKQELDKTSTHVKEIKNIYSDLGREIAKNFKKITIKLDKQIKKLEKQIKRKKQKNRRKDSV